MSGRRTVASFEPLEERRLFSTINWVNEATTDNFGVYGAAAATARQIVHRAIDFWQRVIVNFNHTGGAGNALNLTVTASGGGIANGGATAYDNGGRPTAGSIAVGTGATTHYFDPNSDDGECTDFVTPFAAFAPSVSAYDFYTTMLHEIGHVVGMSTGGSLRINMFTTDTGIDDPNSASPGNLLAVNVGGGPIEATFTESDHGHLWEGPDTPATIAAGLPSHPNDLMNPGRVLFANERFLITDFDANLLSQVYGYSVQLPSQIDTMYAILDSTTGTLTVRGGAGTSNDTITIGADAGQLLVQVNGTSERFNFSDIHSIIVNGGGGNDNIFIDNLGGGGRPVTVSGGDGSDRLTLANASGFLDDITSHVTYDGGADSFVDELVLRDGNNIHDDTFTVTNTTITRPFFAGVTYSNLGTMTLGPGGGNNTINIESLDHGTPLTILSSGGNDDVQLAPTSHNLDSIQAGVFVNGPSNTGIDSITFNDQSNAFGDDWSFSDSQIVRTGMPAPVFYGLGIENLTINAGSGNNVIDVSSTVVGSVNTIRGGGGNDTVRISPVDLDAVSGFGGALIVDGEGDSGAGLRDQLIVNDQNTAFDDNWTVTESTIDKADGFPVAPLVTYSNIENATLNGGAGGTNYDVNIASGTTAFTVKSGGGQDTVTVNATTFTPVTVDGQGGLDHVNVNTDNFGFADVRFANTQHLKDLNIGQGGVSFVEAGGDKVLVTTFLSIATTGLPGQLDLFDNDMIVSSSPTLPAIQALINTARHGGDWSGFGITSSSARDRSPRNTTLGAMRGSDYHGIYGPAALFDGESFSDGAVLVKYTYYGDADFNGRVNFDDYVRTDNGYNNHASGWANGDFNGDGQVNFDDYVLVDLAFNTQSGTL
jgi:hypothetical protein